MEVKCLGKYLNCKREETGRIIIRVVKARYIKWGKTTVSGSKVFRKIFELPKERKR